MDNLGDCSKPIVCLGVTYALAYTCGCGGGRIGPTRCAVIAAARDDRWRTRQASRTSPAAARSAHSALATGSRLAARLAAAMRVSRCRRAVRACKDNPEGCLRAIPTLCVCWPCMLDGCYGLYVLNVLIGHCASVTQVPCGIVTSCHSC